MNETEEDKIALHERAIASAQRVIKETVGFDHANEKSTVSFREFIGSLDGHPIEKIVIEGCKMAFTKGVRIGCTIHSYAGLALTQTLSDEEVEAHRKNQGVDTPLIMGKLTSEDMDAKGNEFLEWKRKENEGIFHRFRERGGASVEGLINTMRAAFEKGVEAGDDLMRVAQEILTKKVIGKGEPGG